MRVSALLAAHNKGHTFLRTSTLHVRQQTMPFRAVALLRRGVYMIIATHPDLSHHFGTVNGQGRLTLRSASAPLPFRRFSTKLATVSRSSSGFAVNQDNPSLTTSQGNPMFRISACESLPERTVSPFPKPQSFSEKSLKRLKPKRFGSYISDPCAPQEVHTHTTRCNFRK
jgi:hypothetical protein